MKKHNKTYNGAEKRWGIFEKKTHDIFDEMEKSFINEIENKSEYRPDNRVTTKRISDVIGFTKFITELLICSWTNNQQIIPLKVLTKDGSLIKGKYPKYPAVINTPYTSGNEYISIDQAIFVLACLYKLLFDNYHFDFIGQLFTSGQVDNRKWTKAAIRQRFQRLGNSDMDNPLLDHYFKFYLMQGIEFKQFNQDEISRIISMAKIETKLFFIKGSPDISEEEKEEKMRERGKAIIDSFKELKKQLNPKAFPEH